MSTAPGGLPDSEGFIMDHRTRAMGRLVAWARNAIVAAGVAASLAAAPAPLPDDAPPAWEFQSHDAFQQAWMTFEAAGVDVHAAHELAHLAVFGTLPVDPDAIGVINCMYWRLKTYWCDADGAYFTSTNVSFRCVSEATQTCPAHTCVFVEVQGPFSSNRPEVCGNLVNCACWPTLSCGTRTCVPWTVADLPGKCPECATQ